MRTLGDALDYPEVTASVSAREDTQALGVNYVSVTFGVSY